MGIKTADAEKIEMTETELSGRLRSLHRAESFCFFASALLIIGCSAVLLIGQHIPEAVLMFVAAAVGISAGGAIGKKKKSLLHTQLEGFFRSALEQAFGPDLKTGELDIDRPLLEKLGLPCGAWEECNIENYHEGLYRGISFSAANVRLTHVYVVSQAHEGRNTCRKEVFRGLVLRLKTSAAPPSPVRVAVRTEGDSNGIQTGNAEFDKWFCVTAEKTSAFLINPQFAESFEELLLSANGRVAGMVWEDGAFTAALETTQGFAVVSDRVNQGDLAALRCSYQDSLRETGRRLDLLIKNPILFSGWDGKDD